MNHALENPHSNAASGVIAGEAMQVLINDIRASERRIAFSDGKRWAREEEIQRISNKLRSEATRHRNEGREDVATVLEELRRWIKAKGE
jgi:hypothetical protein